MEKSFFGNEWSIHPNVGSEIGIMCFKIFSKLRPSQGDYRDQIVVSRFLKKIVQCNIKGILLGVWCNDFFCFCVTKGAILKFTKQHRGRD